MCRNGQYTERGIKALDGYGAELVTLEADFAIPIPDKLGTLGVLTEPSSVLAKAWEQIDRISARACSAHERALVTGAGPIGLLAALMGAQRGLEVHVLDRATEGAKPEAVNALGGRYHAGDVDRGCRGGRAGRGGGVHRRGRAGGRRDAAHRARRHRLPHRRRVVAHPQPGCRRAQQRARARERRGLRLGEREPPPFRAGGQVADATRTRTGSAG